MKSIMSFCFKWLGAEIDLYGSQPSNKAQPINGTFPALAGINSVSRSSLTMVHQNANVLVCYPGDRLHPYVGAGVGWNLGLLGGVQYFCRRRFDLAGTKSAGWAARIREGDDRPLWGGEAKSVQAQLCR